VAIAALRDAEVVIAAAPPPADRGIIATLREQSSAIRLRRIVYLSTSAVYGDRGGARVDFTMAATPNGPRGVARLAAEQAWQTFAAEIGATAIALRIAGIYGPGRNVLADLRCGTARRIDKPGHAFNRIHVDDLARFIAAAAKTTEPTVADAADDEAAPQAEVIAYAAGLIGVEVPALMPFDPAGLSEMARSFWAENKRIDNRASKQALGVALRFPSYREGLQALFAAGEGAA
jgi:nucleoside-diphosphate-sugar epimerase